MIIARFNIYCMALKCLYGTTASLLSFVVNKNLDQDAPVNVTILKWYRKLLIVVANQTCGHWLNGKQRTVYELQVVRVTWHFGRLMIPPNYAGSRFLIPNSEIVCFLA